MIIVTGATYVRLRTYKLYEKYLTQKSLEACDSK